MDVKELFTFALTVFVGYFAVMNPLTKAPVFISLTRGAGIEKEHRVARKAGIAAFLILLSFVLLGKYRKERKDWKDFRLTKLISML